MKVISKLKFYLCCLILFSGLNTFAQDPNFHIYLCFGQSNMAGAGTIETQDRTVDPRFQKMYPMVGCNDANHTFGTWYPAVPPLWGCNSGGLGPADYFGRTMVQNLPTNIKIGVIVVAIPGCDIRLFDKTGYQVVDTGYFVNYIPKKYNGAYGWLMDLAKLAQKDGVIKGFLMHQGETMPDSTKWPGQVKRVYDSLVSDLKLDPTKTPLLAGEVLYKSAGGDAGGHNTTIDTINRVIPNSYVISAEGLVGQDKWHFTAASERTFGARYAQKMLSLESSGVFKPKLNASKQTPHPITYKDGVVQIKLKDNFSYRITDLCGNTIEKGNGIGALAVGAKLTSGIYLLSVKDKMESFTERFFRK
jgi:hypothetical protein